MLLQVVAGLVEMLVAPLAVLRARHVELLQGDYVDASHLDVVRERVDALRSFVARRLSSEMLDVPASDLDVGERHGIPLNGCATVCIEPCTRAFSYPPA